MAFLTQFLNGAETLMSEIVFILAISLCKDG